MFLETSPNILVKTSENQRDNWLFGTLLVSRSGVMEEVSSSVKGKPLPAPPSGRERATSYTSNVGGGRMNQEPTAFSEGG
jgi:hypothetical protein